MITRSEYFYAKIVRWVQNRCCHLYCSVDITEGDAVRRGHPWEDYSVAYCRICGAVRLSGHNEFRKVIPDRTPDW